jgi:hypothetical protein
MLGKGMHGKHVKFPGYGYDIVQVVALGKFRENDSPRNTLSKNRTAVKLGRESTLIYIYI